jgi:hypothetical protein
MGVNKSIMNRLIKYKIILVVLFSIFSCAKEEFSAVKQTDDFVAPDRVSATGSLINSEFTEIKPEVDFLILWDNSSSLFFINEQTKIALSRVIESVSIRFNYHILLAPLIDPTNSATKFLVTENPNDLPASIPGIARVSQSDAPDFLDNFPTATGSRENGVERAIEVINQNVTNNVFRQNAYTMIVVMSNQDDTVNSTGSVITGPEQQAYLDRTFNELMCIRGNHSGNGSCAPSFNPLNSLQMRFMSIVAFEDRCSSQNLTGVKGNTVYKNMSERVYLSPFTNSNPIPTDSVRPFDSFNICNIADFQRIFDGINNSIQSVIEHHQYDHWPIAGINSRPFDPTDVRVVKSTGENITQLFDPVFPGSNGFKVIPGVQTRNTRFFPTPGEPFTGHLIELFGTARVTHPDQLLVTTITPVEFFGFVHLHARPVESSIKLTINGLDIPRSSTNGFELVKAGGKGQFIPSQNLQITSPTDFSSVSPGILKSGFFLKLSGNAIYTNGAVINVIYDPAGS